MLKNVAEDDPDREFLQQSLDKIQIELDGINQNKAGVDTLKRMIELNGLIEGLKDIKLMEGRKLIKEGQLVKISKNKEQERTFFLFSDMLLYAKKSALGKTFILRGLVTLEKYRIIS